MPEPAVVPVRPAQAAPAAPRTRRGVVARTTLVNRLCAAADVPVVAIAAPAGYGKTTLLAQWVERDPRPHAWISLDRRHNDADVLRATVAEHAPSRGAMLLVLDDVDALRSDAAFEVVQSLVDDLPAGSTLALASRAELRLPLPRYRAEGRLVEVGPDDLALTRREAQSLLRQAGVLLPESGVEELERRTEGWPAGLYLAALSLRSGADPSTFAGDDRLVADYLRAEHLAPLAPSARTFLLRTSILDRISPALCDAVLERRDSARRLDSLERSSLLLVALDRSRSAYRYRRLVRDFLRAELTRLEPELVPVLNRRAAEWCEANGAAEAAVEYASAAGDLDRVARLVTQLAPAAHQAGRVVAVERWLRVLDAWPELDRHPDLCLGGAWIHGLRGRTPDAQRWADAAERGLPAADRRRALLRALRCADGVERMLADATVAANAAAPGSRWEPKTLFTLGVALLLAGDEDAADATLARAVEAAAARGAADTQIATLSERSLIATARGAHADATAFVHEAESVPGAGRHRASVTRALALAASARAALARGDRELAAAELTHADRLRPLLTHAVPWLSVQVSLELARVHLAFGEVDDTRTLLQEIDAVLRVRPDLGTLVEQTAALRDQLRALAEPDGRWASSLTSAELRLLPLLVTHLSFREIGDRLCVSRNTVKTQAISVYRKFGVSSRSEAVERAAQLGFVEATAETPSR